MIKTVDGRQDGVDRACSPQGSRMTSTTSWAQSSATESLRRRDWPQTLSCDAISTRSCAPPNRGKQPRRRSSRFNRKDFNDTEPLQVQPIVEEASLYSRVAAPAHTP